MSNKVAPAKGQGQRSDDESTDDGQPKKTGSDQGETYKAVDDRNQQMTGRRMGKPPVATEEEEALLLYGMPEEELPGPGKNQQCTDVFCLLLFICFLCGWGMLGVVAFRSGDPNVLTQGRDMYGALCGVNNVDPPHDLTDKPVLVFPFPAESNISYCAEACPTTLQDPILLNNFESSVALCPYKPVGDKWVTPEARVFPEVVASVPPTVIDSNVFPFNTGETECYFSYQAVEIFGRCIISPSNLEALNSTVFGNVNKIRAARQTFATASDLAEKLLADLSRAKWIIVGGGVGALVLAFVWLVILTFLAKVFVYTSIFLVWLLLAATTCLFAYMYQKEAGYDRLDPEWGVDAQRWSQATLVLTCIFGAILLLYMCLMIWAYPSLKLAIALIQEAACALQYIWSLIFLPLGTFFFLVIVYIWFAFVWVFLYTSGENVVNAAGEFQEYEPDQVLQGMQYYNLFGFFWANAFVIGATQMTAAGAIGLWYYRPKKLGSDGERTSELEKHLWMPVLQSVKNTSLYHLGTVAFGSLVIAICQFATYIILKLQKQVGSDGTLGKILACLAYLVLCMERVLRYLSTNAFIMTAITGDKSFLNAGKTAVLLMMSNGRHLTAVGGVSFFLIFLGKLFVCGATAFATGTVLASDPELNFWTFPFLLILFIAYFIGEAFMSLFQMTINTMLMCLLWDMKLAARGDEEYQGKVPWLSDRLDDYVKDEQKKPKDGKKGGCCC